MSVLLIQVKTVPQTEAHAQHRVKPVPSHCGSKDVAEHTAGTELLGEITVNP